MAQYQFFSTEQFGVYGLGGINISRSAVRGTVEYDGRRESESDSDTEIGLNLGAGGEFGLGGGAGFAELRLVTGDWDRMVISLGYRVAL